MRWKTVVAGALAALVVGAAPADAAKLTPWKPCHRERGPDFECAVATVPLDYDQPAGAQVQLALARVPATDPEHRIGSLFLNPGGPGGPGVEYLLELGHDLYTPEVRARFDLVGFDPRGILQSTPLRCFAGPEQWRFTDFAFPTTPEQEAEWAANDRYLDDACAKRGGPVLDHMSTANVARDMDTLRGLVGDAGLNYAGVSYGSYLGVTYANLFPDKVRALVVDGVLDPIAWSTGRGDEGTKVPFSTRLHSAAGAQLTLSQFFALCDKHASRCAFSGRASRRFALLARRLQQAPVEITYEDGYTETVDYTALISNTLGSLYDPRFWPGLAEWLSDLEAAARGADSHAAALRLQYSVRQPFRAPRTGIEERYLNFIEGFPGVACSDSVNPSDYEAWSIAGKREEARFGYFGRAWTWVSSICAEWPGHDEDAYYGPWDARTANPVLVVGNRYDPATPYQGALTVHSLLKGSALLTLKAWGHTSLFQSSCADEAIGRYLVDLRTPRPGTVCNADRVPFAP